ncbi:MAG: DODA-type extradiol aromatic ring-opening family dioxygenase, partial [Bordetella sp.]|uniref:DODA-type extradiol aromatic ring-opening family dioxygenase n=1 Tax=Bordetella sp. TaxID=28081 RepID=UPI003F7B9AC1
MRWPVLFVSHGSPMLAVEPGRTGPVLANWSRSLPEKPKSVLVVSPHWMTRGVQITAAARPETVHDFGGFPRPLYALAYPAPGAPALAARVQEVLRLAGVEATLDARRGLDHGAWVPLMHLYPEADVPVVQVSL